MSKVFFATVAITLAALGFSAGSQHPVSVMSVRFELFSDDVDRSVEYYRHVLGFEIEHESADYIGVRSGDVVIGIGNARSLSPSHYFNPELNTERRGLGTEIVLEVDNVDAYWERANGAGVAILSKLQTRPWGLRDFRIADPDGYYLRITSKPTQ